MGKEGGGGAGRIDGDSHIRASKQINKYQLYMDIYVHCCHSDDPPRWRQT